MNKLAITSVNAYNKDCNQELQEVLRTFDVVDRHFFSHSVS